MPHDVSLIPVRRINGLVVTASGDDLLVYDEQTKALHTLNARMAAVWQACDSEQSIADLAARIGQPLESVSIAVTTLDNAGLLASPLSSTVRLATSRRALLRKAGITAIPVIVSITVPTAAAASSVVCVVTCGGLIVGTCCDDTLVCTDALRPGVEYQCRTRGGGGIR